MKAALVNSNRIMPPIAPLALDYIAEAVVLAGHQVDVLDLNWADDAEDAIDNFFSDNSHLAIGITFRNIDDCGLASAQCFLDDYRQLVANIRKQTDAPVVVGGVGFSVMPHTLMTITEADYGIWGDGEFVFVELLNRMARNEPITGLNNVLIKGFEQKHFSAKCVPPLSTLPKMSRRWIDNRKYFEKGGQAGIETKRGCTGRCVYCVDPVAKGCSVRTRPAEDVVDELENLITIGVDHFHTCDSEFNIPEWHAKEVCREISRRNLGERVRWYAYCAPVPFSQELASLMQRAGCVGINFGVDSGDAVMLKRLKREHTPDDLFHIARTCRKYHITTMFDLLLGAPGENMASLENTFKTMDCANPDRVGVSVGVRVYQGTEIEAITARQNNNRGLIGGRSIYDPLFFVEQEIADIIMPWLHEKVGNDKRFLFFDPSMPEKNYNYNANRLLMEAIEKGYRGAYWDILRRYA